MAGRGLPTPPALRTSILGGVRSNMLDPYSTTKKHNWHTVTPEQRQAYRERYRASHTPQWYAAKLADPHAIRRCCCCGEQKHVSLFCRNVAQQSGFRSECKACQARQKKRASAGISEAVRWDVWERDNFTCQECRSRRYLVVDHIVPRVLGGSDDPSNLQTLCRKCNAAKDAGVRGGVS